MTIAATADAPGAGRLGALVLVRLVCAAAAVAVAYHYSLYSLYEAWRYQSPLGEVAVVPILAALLLVLAALRHRHLDAIELGRGDILVAGALLAVVGYVMVAAPVTFSTYYWALRLDMLTTPLFLAAVTVLLFGTRSLVALVFPVSFLVLAWPFPYQVASDQWLGQATSATVAVVGSATRLVPVAHQVSGQPGVYLIQTPHGAVSASIASACSGAESVLGVLLVATASTYLLAGRLRRKLAWVGIGCALVWIGNVGRILVLFTAAHRFGPDIAFNLLHPVAGLVVMNVILAVMLASHRLFGLRLRHPGAPAAADSPLSYRAERPPRPRSLLVRLALVAGAAYLVSAADSSLAALSGQFTNAGVTAIADFHADAHVDGPWRVSYVESFPWSRQTFGSDATWDRYMLSPLPPRGGGPPARFTVWLDSVTTPDVGALLVHTVRGCYDFHSEDVSVDRTVSLAGGVEGEQLVYRAGAARWHVVTWQWPVRHAGAVWHERVTLLASTTVRPDAPRPRRSSRGLLGRVVSAVNLFAPDHDTNPALSRALAGVADQVIAARLERRR